MADVKRFTSPATYGRTRAPVEAASTLPPEVYRSTESFAIEAEKLFGRAWVCVGYTCQVNEPGAIVTAMVGGQPIFITRDKDGDLRGFYNVCRHRGSLLFLEDSKVERIRCAYHSWTYDLKGNLLNCPLFAMSGDCRAHGGEDGSGADTFKKADYSLIKVRVEAWGCFIFANLDSKAQPLSEYLGDLPKHYDRFPLNDLVLVRRKKYHINANWKLVSENFLEYYHLPWVHPELCGVTAIEMHQRNQGAGMYMSFFASPLLPGGTPLDADFLPAMPGLGPDEKNSGYFPMVFPNLAMFAMPHHVFALQLTPVAADQTDEYADILVHPSVLKGSGADQAIDEILAFYDMVNMQDIAAVERVQRGIQARAYAGGRMSYRFEEPLHRFQNMVIDFMVDERRTYAGDGPKTTAPS